MLVSTVGQNEEGQRAAIERWLNGNGINAKHVRWFIDKKTDDNTNYPTFKSLQTAIFNGEVQTVVVYKLDRLSRKLRDGIGVLCDWCDKGLRGVSVMQQIDFAGIVGQMIASVLFAVAEMEQETRRERQAEGNAIAKRNRKYKGRKPGTMKAKPQRATKLIHQGLSQSEIAKALGVSRATVQRHLNRVNAAK